MKKVVINTCFGGFGLSLEAAKLFWSLKNITPDPRFDDEVNTNLLSMNIKRDDPMLVRVVESLGEKANGRCADLEIVEVDDSEDWYIEDYDGKEWPAHEFE